MNSQNQCEIAYCSNAVSVKNNRCTSCKSKYDSNGVAFIIYCEFWRYQPVKRNKNKIHQQDITLWICDGWVQRAPYHVSTLVGERVAVADQRLIDYGYILMDIEPAMQ